MIKTLKHLRFMLVMLLATLGMNVAFGATATFSASDLKTNPKTKDGITCTMASSITVGNQQIWKNGGSAVKVDVIQIANSANQNQDAYYFEITSANEITGVTFKAVNNQTGSNYSIPVVYWDGTYNDPEHPELKEPSAMFDGYEMVSLAPKDAAVEPAAQSLTIPAGTKIIRFYRTIRTNAEYTAFSGASGYKTLGDGKTAYIISLEVTTASAADPYTVTFDANGGTCGTTSLTETAAGAGVTLPSATPADEATQELLGWAVSSTETDPAKIFAAGAKYEPADDVTLYAIYGAKTVKSAIVYANTKEASTAALPTEYSEGVGIAEFAALENVTGWNFTGWNPSSISASATGEQTITAEWTKAPRTMFSIVMKDGISKSLAKNGGEQALDATYATVTGGSALVKNTDPSNDGKMQLTNNGIYFNGGNAYLFIALDEELHQGDVISFTSNSTNQICFTLDDTRATSLTTVDKSYTIPAESPLIGKTELYVWRTSSSGTNVKTLTIKTLEDYTPVVKHHVTYAKGDASVTGTLPTQADVKENANFTVAGKGDLAWAGHNFTGWNDGSADYAAGATYTMGTADVVLTAQWEEVDCSAFQVTCTNGQLEPFEEWLTYTRDQNATADIWAFNLVAVTGGTVATYEWYRNTEDSHEGAGLVRWNQDTDPEFHSQYSKLPDVSTPGVYYYFCKVTSTDGCEAYSKTITYTVNAAASSEKKLTRVKFSNGFDAFVKEGDHSVTAYYMGATAPTVVADSWAVSEKATAAVVDNKIVVTAEDGTTQDYAITLTEVTPCTTYGEAITLVDNMGWVVGGLFNGTKGYYTANKSLDEATNMRIAEGKNRINFFVGACENIKLEVKAQRTINVYRNGVKLSEFTNSGAVNEILTIPGDIAAPSMITVVNTNTSGDLGFSTITIVEYIKSTDATLSDLTVNSATIEGFDAATETYNVELPFGTVDVPTVAATKNDEKASDPVITPAASLPGATTVVVTAEDGTTTKTYTINFTVLTTHYIAQVGSTKYETVDDFVAAVSAIADATPTTITLLDNVDLAAKWLVIKPTQEVTLNLNGFMLENTYSQVIAANGKLTITGNGTIRENKASSTYAIRLGNDASLVTLENGTLTNATCTGAVVYGTKGQFVMNGGTITAPGVAINHKNVDIKGGTITAADNALEVAGAISGGTITSTNKMGVYANKSGELNITGGTITGATAAVKLYTTNTKVAGATLNGGFGFAGNASALLLPGSDAAIVATTDIEVYEGTTLLGYTTSALTDKIGKAGQTLKLTKDVTTDHYLAINADLDLNGHNITSSDVAAIYVAGTSATTGFRNITIKGEGNVTANNGAGCVAVMAGKFVHLTIEGGNYSAGGDADNAVIYIADNGSAGPSVVEIKGGHFESGDNQWILNIKDGLAAGGAKFITTGGTYAGGFMPDNCNVDGPHTNLCPENYGGILNADGSVTVIRLYTFSKWNGTDVNFEKKNAADELEFTTYSTNTGGRQNGSTALKTAQRIDRTDATAVANVLQASQFVIKFEKEVKQVKLYAYNGNTGRNLSSVQVTDADNIDATPSWSDAGFTLTTNTLATDYDYEYVIDGHFEAGKYYFIKTSSSVSFFDIFYTESVLESEATGIVAGTIDGVDMTAEQIADLNGAEHTLTLAGAVSIAPEVVFNYKHTATYDDAFVKTLVNVTETADEATVGATYEMTKAFEGVTYKVVAAIDYTPALMLDETAGTAAIVGKTGRSKEFTVVLTGANLAAGEYSINVPAVDGLSIDLTTFTVGADNKVNETFIITYASDADVAEAVANIEFTANTLVAEPASKTATFALTYSSVAWVEPTVVVPVSEHTTWTWSADITSTDEMTESTTPLRDAEFILSSVIAPTSEFRSECLKVAGQYANRKDGTKYYFQGGKIAFETTVPGIVTMTYSNTGGSSTSPRDARVPYVNGVKSNCEGATTTQTLKGSFAVEAGEVSITAFIDGNATSQYLRIYELEFTPFDATVRDGMTIGKVATYCGSKNVIAHDGATFYFISNKASDLSSIELTEVDGELKAGYPYIVVAEKSEIRVVYGDVVDTEAKNYNGLYGVLGETVILVDGDYIIKNNKYYRAHTGNGNYVQDGRAYLRLDEIQAETVAPGESAPAPARARRITMGNAETSVTTGMDAIQMTEDLKKIIVDGQLFIIRGGKMFNAAGALVK